MGTRDWSEHQNKNGKGGSGGERVRQKRDRDVARRKPMMPDPTTAISRKWSADTLTSRFA